jgi:hypothetical protein
MDNLNVHLLSRTEENVDFSSALPDEILEKVFLELPLSDVVKLNLVCKRWNRVSRSNLVWQKFVPNYPGICLPKADTKLGVFQKLWLNSLRIGTERWFPNPLPDLVNYDAGVREEESKEYGETVESKCVLYLRLNPVYPFTTDGRNTNNSALVNALQVIFDKFGHIDLDEWESPDNMGKKLIYDGKSTVKHCHFCDKKFFMEVTVDCLESKHFLEFKKNPDREAAKCDEEGYRVKNTKLAANSNFVDESENEYNNAKTRLPDDLFNQIRTVVIGKNRNFIVYYLNDGCLGGTIYTRNLLVSDTAVVYAVQHYGDES